VPIWGPQVAHPSYPWELLALRTEKRSLHAGLATSIFPTTENGEMRMIPHTPQADHFIERMRASLQADMPQAATRTIAKHAHVYTCGEHDAMVYVIVSGHIKLLVLAPDGKQCLLAIYTAGDIFGELCLAEGSGRRETATAMEDTIVKQIPCTQFLLRLSREALLEGFVRYLAVRIADQQQVIAHLVTVDSEQRLAQTLLHLAHQLGQHDPRSIRIVQKISHAELAEMVGTTRPRVSHFMKRFRDLGLIELTLEHQLIIKEQRLMAYVAQLH
jgi:CRP/FNR family transcriptional regulator, cyclic AMP receptor protein